MSSMITSAVQESSTIGDPDSERLLLEAKKIAEKGKEMTHLQLHLHDLPTAHE
jgi:hypothetical protein